MKIGLISDNHGYFGPDIVQALEGCDEIWHAGDIGSLDSVSMFSEKFVFRAVYGNIDDTIIRLQFPETLIWELQSLKFVMTHIGGYPGKYPSRILKLIDEAKPDVFICGHSHILKVMKDPRSGHLHMNPGSYGHQGFHVIRTLLRFEISGGKITQLQAVELGRRGIIS